MGKAKNVGYYDLKYAETEQYHVHYSESVYFTFWKLVHELYLKGEEDSRILDIGCGVGQFANFLYDQKFTRYIGMDFSRVAIDMAKMLNLNCYKFSVASIENIIKFDVFNRLKLDVIICLEVLEHLGDNLDIKLIESMPYDKTIIFSVPSFDSASHERYFSNMDSVLKRYGGLLMNIDSFTYEIPNSKSKLFGVRANRKPLIV